MRNHVAPFFRTACLFCFLLLMLGCGSIGSTATNVAPILINTSSPSPVPNYPSIVYDKLTRLDIPSGTRLIASPAFPKSQLADTSIDAGESVYLIAGDKDSAWLLVIYRNTIGWVPSILSAIGTGVLNPITIQIPEPPNCATFLGSITSPSGAWTSNINAVVFVQGYIYIQGATKQDADINLEFLVEETGQLFPALLDRTPLDVGDELILFSATINDVEQGNHIKYDLGGVNQNVTPFQSAFFVNDCSNTIVASASDESPPVPFASPIPVSTLIVRITSSAIPPTLVQPKSDFANYSCPDKSKVKLRVGDRAVVSRDDVNLRSSPKVPNVWDANIVAILYDGNKMTVIGGPHCAHDGTWWEIETDRGYTGWVREFLPSRILIEPIE